MGDLINYNIYVLCGFIQRKALLHTTTFLKFAIVLTSSFDIHINELHQT